MRHEAGTSTGSPHKGHIIAAIVTALAIVTACVGLTFFLNAVYAQRLPPAPPPIIGQNCGEVGVQNGYVSGSPHATDCLWHAYQASCQKATLDVGYFGIDAGTDYYLTVQPQHGTCAVTDASQSHQSSGNITGKVVNHFCGGLLQQFGGLVAFGCGTDDNIVMPHISATISAPGVPSQTNVPPPTCGTLVRYAVYAQVLGEGDTLDNPDGPIACFATNWTKTCAQQQLTFVQFTGQSVVQETFAILIQSTSPCQRVLTLTTQSRTLTTPPSDITIVTCTGLKQNAAGLVISGCGTQAPLVIPAPASNDPPVNASPPQIGHVCQRGEILAYRTCFWPAYQACQPVTISAFFAGNPEDVMESVSAQPVHGHCTLTATLQFAYPFNAAVLATATCASAQEQDNEIVVSGCGAFGDIIFP